LQRSHPRLERAKFRVQRGLVPPDEHHVQENHGEDDAVRSEQVSQIFHQLDSITCLSDAAALANASFIVNALILVRVRN
jgi:hypothetical protein